MAATTDKPDAADSHVDVSLMKLPNVHAVDKEVPTGEEGETEIYSHRAKLYRMHEGEWKERCTGNLRLLKDNTTGRVRMVMREGGMESLLRANHLVPPDAKLEFPVGVENMVYYTAVDNSDGTPEGRTFLVKMKTTEIIADFIKQWDAARATNGEVLTGQESAAGAGGGAGSASAAVSTAPKGTAVHISSDLSTIYGAGDTASARRVDKLESAFTAKFGQAPAYFVRAPGRVNIIGEHVDYHGYGVLPFALNQDILLAVGTADGTTTVSASSTDEAYPDASFPIDLEAPVAPVTSPADWVSYLQCGFKAAFATAGAGGVAPSKGLRVMVDSVLPGAGGVSSSSALVVASALAAVHAYGLGTPMNLELARLTRDAEVAVGTLSGGMDQAACLLGKAGSATHITFHPHLAGAAVPLPLNAIFLVADSGVPAAKAEEAATKYNRRVVEGALGVKLVAMKEGKANWKDLSSMFELQAALGLASSSPVEAEVFLGSLPPTPVTAAALAGEEYFNCPLESLFPAEDTAAHAALAALGDTPLALKDRLSHVLQEAGRVLEAQKVLTAGGEDTLASLGALMDASHDSLVTKYDASCAELDALVAAAKGAGACGARLVGAGWGGCAVILVQMGSVEAVKTGIKDHYASIGKPELAERMFTAAPASGAAVYLPAEEEEL